MSIQLMSLTFMVDMPPSKKIVLLALCDRADDDGGSLHPSVRNIAKKASMSERQTQRMMRELENDGYLLVIGNKKGGRGVSRLYQINVRALRIASKEKKDDNLTPFTGNNQNDPERVTSGVEKGDNLAPITPQRVTSGVEKGDIAMSPDTSVIHQDINNPYSPLLDDFEDLWKKWTPYDMPKGSKSLAKKSYLKARKETSHETIVGGAEKYCAYCQAARLRTRHVCTWLNQRGWEDELPAVVGRTAYADTIKDAGRAALDNILRKDALRKEACA